MKSICLHFAKRSKPLGKNCDRQKERKEILRNRNCRHIPKYLIQEGLSLPWAEAFLYQSGRRGRKRSCSTCAASACTSSESDRDKSARGGRPFFASRLLASAAANRRAAMPDAVEDFRCVTAPQRTQNRDHTSARRGCSRVYIQVTKCSIPARLLLVYYSISGRKSQPRK